MVAVVEVKPAEAVGVLSWSKSKISITMRQDSRTVPTTNHLFWRGKMSGHQ